ISPFSYPARHARYDDSPDPFPGTGARLWYRAAAGADFALRRSSQPGLSLPRTPQIGAEAMAEGRVEAIGDRTRGQVLLLDEFRTQTARPRERKLGAAVGSGPVDF